MERNTAAHEPLAALEADRTRMADRARMPIWYHALVGVTATALVLGGLLPDDWSTWAMPVILVTWVALMLYPPRRSGIAMSSWSAPTILLALALLVVLLLAIVLVNVISVQERPWGWLIVPALVAFGAGWLLSVSSERLVRRELTRER